MSALLALFANPLFLPGLLAGSLPVLIHLLSRQRARRIILPTARFLKLTTERTASRRRLEDLLLLLLRSGALLALALALAGPVLEVGGLLAGRGRMAVGILLDNSLSAGQETGRGTALEAGRRTALRLAADLPAGTRWAVRSAVGPAASGQDWTVRPAAEAEAAVRAVAPTGAAADLAREVAALAAELAQVPAARRELHIFTDRQQASWRGLEAQTPPPAAERPPRIFVNSPAGAGGANLAVTDLLLDAPAVLAGSEATLTVTLQNHGPQPAATPLILQAGGLLVERRDAILPAGGNLQAQFKLPLSRAGWLDGFVSLGEDGCAFDNRRYFALPVRPEARVLLIEGEPERTSPTRRRAGYYLEAALSSDAGGRTHFERRSAAAEAGGLSGWDAIFYNAAVPPAPAVREALENYVRTGGTLVLLPAVETVPVAWNAAWGGGLEPAPLGELAHFADPGPTLTPGDRRHPLLAPYAAGATDLLGRARVAAAFTIAVPEELAPAAPVRLGKNAFIMTKKFGSGRVALWAAPPAPEWTSLPLKPVFVPLVRLLVFHGLTLSGRNETICGYPLDLAPDAEGESAAAGKAFAAKVALPDGRSVPVEFAGGSEGNGRFAETFEPGVYRVDYLRPTAGERRLAVNPAGVEADLTALPPERLRELLRPLGETEVFADPDEYLAAVGASRRGLDLTWALLGLTLAFLVAEAGLTAWRARRAGD